MSSRNTTLHESIDRMLPLVYQELRAMAHRQLGAQARGGTLQTTALVHEAYLKLVAQSRVEPRDRTHFLAVASIAMRHILVDRAKARLALKSSVASRSTNSTSASTTSLMRSCNWTKPWRDSARWIRALCA